MFRSQKHWTCRKTQKGTTLKGTTTITTTRNKGISVYFVINSIWELLDILLCVRVGAWVPYIQGGGEERDAPTLSKTTLQSSQLLIVHS